MADRLSRRGGAYSHLMGVLERQLPDRDVQLAVGRVEPDTAAPCPVHVVAGLDARTREAVALDPLLQRLRPEHVHLHNPVNPAVLEWGARVGAVATLQDHRAFCPSRGKWTADGRVCRDPMARDTCAACFEDAGYFDEIYAVTAERLDALRRLRAVVVLSRYMKDELVAAGVPGSRVHVVPPFVHDLVPVGEGGPPCVLFTGRLVESKGVREAIGAWRGSGLELPLVVAGAGPLRPLLEDAGARCLGWQERPRLAALYRDAAALLLPSRWQEPFGMVGLEALSFGTPVVAWDSGGVREWHPGDETLVPWGDVDGLAHALRAAVRRRASAAAEFAPEAMMRRLDAVYAGA